MGKAKRRRGKSRNGARARRFSTPKNPGDLWIFGYGSLMWHPGFAFAERAPALLRGYHRAFCIYSHRYRGTKERPGLVLGLRPGGSCYGIAYRVGARDRPSALAYLTEREMLGKVYHERFLPVTLADGRRVPALAYVVNRTHPNYSGRLSVARTAAVIAEAKGERGASLDYLVNTVRHLDEIGISDGPMHELLALVERKRRP